MSLRLAGLIDGQRFEEAFGSLYWAGKGRPGLPTRPMVGLHPRQKAKAAAAHPDVDFMMHLAQWGLGMGRNLATQLRNW